MSKRRNQKKEKASRNQAYARQFRKKTARSFSKGRRFSSRDNSNNNNDSENNEQEEKSSHS
ncbi:MAG: hypothetical protein ACOC0N_08020 [Chroococcales cyanobacterium]